MVNTLPPVRGAAFTFYTGLVSQADTDVFRATPTIAAESRWLCLREN